MSKRNTPENFWKNILINDNLDECWEWKSKIGTNEYGSTRWDGRWVSSHRKAYELSYGEIPDGMFVCHSCDNPPCCNPRHLFLGTRQDNVNDREQKGRNKLPHSKGEDHGIHKLTEKQIKKIRQQYSLGGYSYYSLADMYGVSFGNIRKIIKRQTWGWLQ